MKFLRIIIDFQNVSIQLWHATMLTTMAFSIKTKKHHTQHNDIQHYNKVLLCWISQILPSCWMSSCWVSWHPFLFSSNGICLPESTARLNEVINYKPKRWLTYAWSCTGWLQWLIGINQKKLTADEIQLIKDSYCPMKALQEFQKRGLIQKINLVQN